MLRLAVFDIAGTTVCDPDGVGRCLKAALTGAGVPWDHETVNSLMGIPKPVVIRTMLDAAGMQGDVKAIHEDFRQRMIDYYRSSPEVRPIEGAEEAFKYLRWKGVLVSLDTGFDRTIVEAILDRLDWRNAVDFTVSSDEVAKGRPAPDLVVRAMSLAAVNDPRHVAKIGDTPSDLGEGMAAGCGLVIGVCYGTHTREALAGHPHTHLADSMAEVVEILLR